MYLILYFKLYYCIMNSQAKNITTQHIATHTLKYSYCFCWAFSDISHCDLFSSHRQACWTLSHFLINNRLDIAMYNSFRTLYTQSVIHKILSRQIIRRYILQKTDLSDRFLSPLCHDPNLKTSEYRNCLGSS